MEKLLLILILNSPDGTASMQKVESPNCIARAETLNTSPSNRVVYQDELGDVRAVFAACEYLDGTRIVVPTILRKAN